MGVYRGCPNRRVNSYMDIYMPFHCYVLQGFCILYGYVMLCHNSWALDDGKISMSAISRHHGIQQARLADQRIDGFYFTKHLLLLLGNIIDNLRKTH